MPSRKPGIGNPHSHNNGRMEVGSWCSFLIPPSMEEGTGTYYSLRKIETTGEGEDIFIYGRAK